MYYLNTLPDGTPLHPHRKVMDLLAAGAVRVNEGSKWVPDLVIVAVDKSHDAACHCVTPNERDYIVAHPDKRPKVWLHVPGAGKLSGFTGSVEAKRLASDPGRMRHWAANWCSWSALEAHLGFVPRGRE